MVQLYVPPSLRRLESHITKEEPLSPHLCFCYDLAEAVRPSVVVDLGASDAASFFALCRGLSDHDVDGFCYAVDLWGKEPPEQAYSPEMEHLMMTARKHFLGITSFIRARPHDALRHFEEASIDILRIDGGRPALFPATDIAEWVARVRPGGWVLVAGTSEPQGKAIAEAVPTDQSSFAFFHARGMTVIRRPGGEREGDSQLSKLLADPSGHAELRRFYAHAQDHLELTQTIQWQNYGPGRGGAGKKGT